MEDFGFGFSLGVLLGAAFAGFMIWADLTQRWERDLIMRGHAIYCPHDGAFAFVGECDK